MKRPKKKLIKADPEKRAAFVKEYVTLPKKAQSLGAKIFIVDEAHFRAKAQLHSQWVQRG